MFEIKCLKCRHKVKVVIDTYGFIDFKPNNILIDAINSERNIECGKCGNVMQDEDYE